MQTPEQKRVAAKLGFTKESHLAELKRLRAAALEAGQLGAVIEADIAIQQLTGGTDDNLILKSPEGLK